MANHGVYAVLDKASAAFLPLFLLPTDNVAIREFLTLAQQKDHQFCIHAKDYSLYRLGSWDDNTGMLTVFKEPQFVIGALIRGDGNGAVND